MSERKQTDSGVTYLFVIFSDVQGESEQLEETMPVLNERVSVTAGLMKN